MRNNQERHCKRLHINRHRISPSFFIIGSFPYFKVPPLGGSRDKKVVFPVDKKAFCVLVFAKTESIVTVQGRFQVMYHTEPPTDKTPLSGCLCAGKRSGRPGPLGWYCRACARSVCQEPSEVSNSQMSQSSVWRILRKRLRVKGFRLQLLQAVTPRESAWISNSGYWKSGLLTSWFSAMRRRFLCVVR
jgi:hypothetical protein